MASTACNRHDKSLIVQLFYRLNNPRKGWNGAGNIVFHEQFMIEMSTCFGLFFSHVLQGFETFFQWKPDGFCTFSGRAFRQTELFERCFHRACDERLRVAERSIEVQNHNLCLHLRCSFAREVTHKIAKNSCFSDIKCRSPSFRRL